MKKKLVSALLFFCMADSNLVSAQVGKEYRNFPIVLSVQFHSLSHPFRDLSKHFKNIGFGIGSELALGGKHNWAQQFHLSWYNNKQSGNGFLLYTQSAWRPTIVSNVYTELKAGFGLLASKGKCKFILPTGASIGYYKYANETFTSPFVSYQVLFTDENVRKGPLRTNNLVQAGVIIHPR